MNMRKRILLTGLLLTLVFSMVACGKDEAVGKDVTSPTQTESPTVAPKPTETPNAEPTEEPIPTPTLAPTPKSTETPTPTPKPTPIPEIALKLELKDTEHPRIMEILDFSGEFMDELNNMKSNYSYQIPQFRADSDSAKSLNQRIVDEIFPYVESEANVIMGGNSLLHYGIHYEITEFEDIVSILIKIPYPNDGLEFYIYNYDFAKDKELTNAEILAIKGMTEEAFIEAAHELQEESMDWFLDDIPDEYKEGYLYMLKEANELTKVDAPMYLDEDGTLNAVIFYVDGVGDIRERIFEFK